MLTVRKLFALLTVVALLLSMAAVASAEENVTITLAIHVANCAEQEPAVYAAIQAFQEANPDVTIDLIENASEDHITQMRLWAQTGELPDIFWCTEGDVPEYGNNGFLLLLDEFLETYPEVSGALSDAMKSCYVNENGEIIGLPYTSLVTGFYYNKAIFDEYGVEYPSDATTYEDVLSMIETFSEGGMTTFAQGAMTNYSVWGWLDCLLRYGYVENVAALTAGEADMAFVQEPDAATLRTLRAPDSPLEATPLARQALVVFVHRDNPLPGLTLAQLRDIYSGTITNWRDVGGPDAAMLPFQYADGTAQQTFLRERILNGRSPLPPLREEIFREFPRVQIAAYRNLPGALGFDFRARLRLCFDDDEVRLLSVDGVVLTDANIRDAFWPFTVSYVLLTRREASAETRALRDWLLGPEGRDFITRCGFVPLF